jgi:hypothetical protein
VRDFVESSAGKCDFGIQYVSKIGGRRSVGKYAKYVLYIYKMMYLVKNVHLAESKGADPFHMIHICQPQCRFNNCVVFTL